MFFTMLLVPEGVAGQADRVERFTFQHAGTAAEKVNRRVVDHPLPDPAAREGGAEILRMPPQERSIFGANYIARKY
jgi:hypothetical protein